MRRIFLLSSLLIALLLTVCIVNTDDFLSVSAMAENTGYTNDDTDFRLEETDYSWWNYGEDSSKKYEKPYRVYFYIGSDSIFYSTDGQIISTYVVSTGTDSVNYYFGGYVDEPLTVGSKNASVTRTYYGGGSCKTFDVYGPSSFKANVTVEGDQLRPCLETKFLFSAAGGSGDYTYTYHIYKAGSTNVYKSGTTTDNSCKLRIWDPGDYVIYVTAVDGAKEVSDYSRAYFTVIDSDTLDASEFKAAKTVTFNNNTYSLYEYGTSWTKASEVCEALGGHLVSITSSEEQEAMASLAAETECKTVLLGASKDDNGEYHWTTGETFDYTNSYNNEIYGDKNQIRLVMETDTFYWYDHDDEVRQEGDVWAHRWSAFICEWGSPDTLPQSQHIVKLSSSLDTIEEEAFANSSLETVIIPESCSAIQSGAFKNCTNLKYVQFLGSKPTIASDAFSGCGKIKFYDANGYRISD